jgi:ornithine cyclodeaminase/alanine dehydrogenase-like protein (mu-crystallin family)
VNSSVPLFLSAIDLQACLPDADIYSVVEQTLRDLGTTQVISGPKSGFGFNLEGDYLHMGSVSGCVLTGSGAAGIKWFVTSDLNTSRGLPRVPATLLISDARTGLLRGVIDATQLTPDRTAASAVVAVAAATQGKLESVAIVGSGLVGQAIAKYLAITHKVSRIAFVSNSDEGARAAADATRAFVNGGPALSSSTDVQSSVRDCDAVFCATSVTADADLLKEAWLKPDAVVCTIGSHREVDAELIKRATVIVDDREGVKSRGSLASGFRTGDFDDARVFGDIGSLVAQRLDLPSRPRRLLIVSVGLGVLDVALGGQAIEHAKANGYGIHLASNVAGEA